MLTIIPICIGIVALLIVLAYILHTVDRVRPWWQPTRRQRKARRRRQVITLTPNRKRSVS